MGGQGVEAGTAPPVCRKQMVMVDCTGNLEWRGPRMKKGEPEEGRCCLTCTCTQFQAEAGLAGKQRTATDPTHAHNLTPVMQMLTSQDEGDCGRAGGLCQPP